MLAGKKFTDYTNLVSHHDFKKYDNIEAIDKTNLSEQTKLRLDETSKIENYFIEEINQRKSCNKKLSKYIAVFDYIDKLLIILSATTWEVSIILFTIIIGALVVGVSISRNNKKIIEYNKTKKKNHDKILMLAKSKLKSIDTLIFQALIDMDISHEESITILKEKDRYEMMKDKLRNRNGKPYEIIRFNSVKSKI